MPKTLSATIETVAQSSTNQPHYLIEIELDGLTKYYTDNNEDVNFPTAGGNTYKAWGIKFSKILNTMTNEVDRVNITFDNANPADTDSPNYLLRTYTFQNKKLTIKRVFAGYLASASNYMIVFKGYLGAPVIDENTFGIMVYSPMYKINQNIPKRMYQGNCPHIFGSKECNRFSGPVDNLVGWWPLDKAHEIYGDELVRNGTMEFDGDWTDDGSPAANVQSSEQAHGGTYSRKITLDGSGTSGGIRQTISGLTIGKTYKVTAWVRGLDLAASNFYLFFNGDFTPVLFSNGSWVKLTGIRTVDATSTTIRVYVHPTSAANAGKSFYVDDVSVKEIQTADVSGNDNHGRICHIPTYSEGRFEIEDEEMEADGTDDYVDIGDISASLKAVSLWVNPHSANETIISFDSGGAHSVSIDSSIVTAHGFVGSYTYINNEYTATLTSTARCNIIINVQTIFAVDDLDFFRCLATYGNLALSDIRIFEATLTKANRQLINDITEETNGEATVGCSTSVIFDTTNRTESDDYWNYGTIEFTSGACDGQKRLVKDSVSASGKVEVYIPLDDTPSDTDTYTIKRGCNKNSKDCRFKFNNWQNMGGFALLPQKPDRN